jgi:exodeoxyribonuclease VII large subunit
MWDQWDQMSLFSGADQPYSVSEVTGRIRTLLEQETEFQDLWVEGEISNFHRASSGHIYFTLKDAGAQLGAVIWRSQARQLNYMPQEGDQAVAHGHIGLYEQGGRYQIYVDALQPAGRGSLYQEYERLKAKLEAEGLFDRARKRALPPFPACLGVVTSPTSAAFQDVLNVLRRRYPLVRVLLAPTLVQGERAPAQIVRALDYLNARDDVDLILVVRGGGSIEDLWAFNDERVARSIAASRIPVVSGVGHETDVTLADFAADRRAPTPSAAAEVATPDARELGAALDQVDTRLRQAMTQQLATRREQLTMLERTLRYLSPRAKIADARQRTDDITVRLDAAARRQITWQRQRVEGLTARLASVSPESVLRRGYAIIRERETGAVLISAGQAEVGLGLSLQFHDGELPARVEGSDDQ